MPFIASSDASVAPDGPLPMMPTVLMVVLINRNWFYGLATNAGLFARLARFVNIKSCNLADKPRWFSGQTPAHSPLDSKSPQNRI
jgi:hypothetical protein